MSEHEMFPIMKGADIPWEFIERYKNQAYANHKQTLERLAERGGLDPREALAVVQSQGLGDPVYRMAPEKAADALEKAVAEQWYIPRIRDLEADNEALERTLADYKKAERKHSMDIERQRLLLDEAKLDLNKAEAKLDAAQAQLAQSQQEAEAWQEVALHYSQHVVGCPGSSDEGNSCSCGFSKSLRAALKTGAQPEGE